MPGKQGSPKVSVSARTEQFDLPWHLRDTFLKADGDKHSGINVNSLFCLLWFWCQTASQSFIFIDRNPCFCLATMNILVTKDSVSDPCQHLSQAPEDKMDFHGANVQKQLSRSWGQSRFYRSASDVRSHTPGVWDDALRRKKRKKYFIQSKCTGLLKVSLYLPTWSALVGDKKIFGDEWTGIQSKHWAEHRDVTGLVVLTFSQHLLNAWKNIGTAELLKNFKEISLRLPRRQWEKRIRRPPPLLLLSLQRDTGTD